MEEDVRGRSGLVWGFIAGVVAVVAVLAAVVVLVVLPQVQKVKADIVRFQKVAQVGPGPFTPPAEARASAAAALAQGGGGQDAPGGGGASRGAPPAGGGGGGGDTGAAGSGAAGTEPGTFGGTGSNQVCDREKLIKALVADPDRLRAWARTLEIDPTPEAVTAYIRNLRPVTLTRDTQVTNHAFVDGRVNPYQAIMQKGTAVLVDKDGKPVVRCRCGNPLTEPAELAQEVRCVNCPPNYQPPRPCEYEDFEDSKYESYNDQQFAREYGGAGAGGGCYRPVPDPPPVEPHDEPPDETEACREDPNAPGCRERCQEDPSLPHCDQAGDQQEGAQDGEATGEGEATTGTGEAPSGGGAPSDGGTTPPDSGGSPSEGGTSP